jgi:hypothetical protein
MPHILYATTRIPTLYRLHKARIYRHTYIVRQTKLQYFMSFSMLKLQFKIY